MAKKATRTSTRIGRELAKLMGISRELRKMERAAEAQSQVTPATLAVADGGTEADPTSLWAEWGAEEWKAKWRQAMQSNKQLRQENAKYKAQIEEMKSRKLANFSIDDILKEVQARTTRLANKVDSVQSVLTAKAK